MLESFIASLGNILLSNPFLFFLAAFLLIAIFGDPSIILLFVLYMELGLPLLPLFALSYFASLFADVFWFTIERRLFKKLEKYRIFGKPYSHLLTGLEKVAHRNAFVSLFFSKFLYGTRILAVIHLSKRKISFWRFLAYSGIANIAWALFACGIGYLVGIGFSFVANAVKNIELAITFLIVFFVVFIMIRKKINEEVENKNKKIRLKKNS